PKTVPATGSTWEMPAVEVATRTTVRGTVTDAAGRPVSGATVVGVWVEYGYRLRAGMARIVTVTSGSQGEFTIPGVDSSKQVWLKAIGGSGCTERPVVVRGAGLANSVSLRIDPEFTRAMAGRVVGEDGGPQAGATVEVWWRPASAGLLAALP